MRKSWLFPALALAALSAPSHAFGLRTHLWIAQSIYDDMADCHLTLRGESFEVPRETCGAVNAHRGAFLAGAIGPDAFPDIVTGQSIIHPGDGKKGEWVTADWLNHLLQEAKTPEELAFSAGFLLHAAGDIFAHSYVNNYAGDIFDLMDERVVERRHTLLERYIDRHMPDPESGPVSPWALDAPYGFIANSLIFHDDAQRENSAKWQGGHHVRLARLRARVNGFVKKAVEREKAELAGYGRTEAAVDSARRALEADPGNGKLKKAVRKAEQARQRAEDRLVEASEVLAFTTEWERGLRVVATEYLRASLGTSRHILGGEQMVGEGNIATPYQTWFRCHRQALFGEPVEIGRQRCRILEDLGITRDYRDLRTQALFPSYGRLMAGLRAWQRQIGRETANAMLKMSVDFLRQTRGLIDDMTRSEPVTSKELDAIFATAAHDKRLLVFDSVFPLIHADIGLDREGGKLDPEAFKALDYALLLGKLALLDQNGIEAVTRAYGGDADRLRLSRSGARYSVLVDTVRSLDGNHQWMQFGMPYPRSTEDEPTPEKSREFGYGPASTGDRHGFPYFADAQLREKVFSKLFPTPFEGRILCRPEFRLPDYKYPPMEHDPFRNKRDEFCGRDGN